MRISPLLTALTLTHASLTTATPPDTNAGPLAHDPKHHITYHGLHRAGIEAFLGIRYAHSPSGAQRFRPPRAYTPRPGSTISAVSFGPSCPQPRSLEDNFPLVLSESGEGVSEDCLNLNVVRPRGTRRGEGLPVMVWIHGGSFWTGSNKDVSYEPDGMVLESVGNGLPVVHVAVNYRLGVFGFALNDALRKEGSTNAALRDQRLAIEWVRDNIEYFGGDPARITIFGQSSGGLAVGLQTMAYGGTKPVPFQQGICQSQALEPGITGNFTINEMQLVVDKTGCNATDLHSAETIACLRNLDMQSLLDASVAVHVADISNNIGDSWLPAVYDDFLPAPPSVLTAEGRFAKIPTMIGWTDNDVAFYTPTDIHTEQDTFDFVASYLPSMRPSSITDLLALYPSSDFAPDPQNSISSETTRSARIFRDILMTCMPVWYGSALSRAGAPVYLFDFNQTLLDPIFTALHKPALGAIHTSEFAYVFGNISHYDVDVQGYRFNPADSDYRLQTQVSRSWSAFAAVGRPSVERKQTLRGWEKAFSSDGETRIFVVGGPEEGLSALDGEGASDALARQRLRERCGFLNSEEIRGQMDF